MRSLKMLCKVLLLLLLVTDYEVHAFSCPRNFCLKFVCHSPASCPDGQLLRPNASLCGCCAECVSTLPAHADCSSVLHELNIGAAVTHDCDRGFTCDPIIKRCEGLKSRKIPHRQCYRGLCFCVAPNGRMMVDFKVPEPFSLGQTCLCARAKYKTLRQDLLCDPSGSFEPMQCSKDICFCVDRFGKRLPNSPQIEALRGFELQCPSHKLFS